MASLDWSQCPAVESIPGKVSGAWVFADTRTPVAIVFENLEDGMTIDEGGRAVPGDAGGRSRPYSSSPPGVSTRLCPDADAYPLRQTVRREAQLTGYRVTPSRNAARIAGIPSGTANCWTLRKPLDSMCSSRPDRNMRYQQNLTHRKIAIVVLSKGRWRLIKNRLPEIAAAVGCSAARQRHRGPDSG